MEMFFNLSQINHAAQQFWAAVNNQRIFAFHGDLGAGKTTFITALCHEKGVKEEPSSPTFSLINEYQLEGNPNSAYHIDIYRINDEEEAVHAGIEDCLYSQAYCFIEWSEKIPHLLPEDTLHAYISIENEGRKIVWE